jgi:hypothetical protein
MSVANTGFENKRTSAGASDYAGGAIQKRGKGPIDESRREDTGGEEDRVVRIEQVNAKCR